MVFFNFPKIESCKVMMIEIRTIPINDYLTSSFYQFCTHVQKRYADHLHASKNILIEQLIAFTSRLDALVAHKNVLQPMGIQQSMAIKQPSQLNSHHKRNIQYNPILRMTLGRQYISVSFGVY